LIQFGFMKYLFSFFALTLSWMSFGQSAPPVTITDTPNCFYHGLHAAVTAGIVPVSSGITVDDGWSSVFPIGFTFNFYGTPNTQCIIGSNGCLGFNLASAGAYNTWPIGATLAATSSPDIRNVICGPWCDVLISAGGSIQFSVQGSAPNRNFAVTWCGTAMYSCTSEWLTTQIIMYETSDIVEVHIQHRTICSTSWNGSKAIVGVKNAAGTASTVAPGRDYPATWTVPVPEAWRFTPIAGPSYSVSSIPYSPIPYASSTVFWYDSTTHAYLGSGPDLQVAPTVPTTYEAGILGCNDTLWGYVHVDPPVGPQMHLAMDYGVRFFCDSDVAYFFSNSTPASSAFATKWIFGDGDSSFAPNVVHTYTAQGTYTAHLNFSSVTYGCPLDTAITLELNHPLVDSFGTDYKTVCLGVPFHFTNYSSSSTNGVSTTDLLKYSWSFGRGRGDTAKDPVFTYPAPGVYAAQLTITDTIGCQKTYIDTLESIFLSVRTRVHDTTVCLFDSMGMASFVTVVPDTVPVSYTWANANNIGITTNPSSRFFGIGVYVYTVTVATPTTATATGCFASDTQRVTSGPPVTLTNLTTSPVTIPYGNSIQLNANGAVFYRWRPDNGTLNDANINNPVATPRDATTVYTVYGMSVYGCLDSANIIVNVDNTIPEGVPSGFTPNNDGINDVFKVSGLTFQNMVEFRVFNRWGQEMFMTNDPKVGWDGTFHGEAQDMGVYNWVIILGHTDGGQKVYKGTVTLLR